MLNTNTRVTLAVAEPTAPIVGMDSNFDGDQSSDTLWLNSKNGATLSSTVVKIPPRSRKGKRRKTLAR